MSTSCDQDDISWYNKLERILGPPVDIDFEKEAARRARDGVVIRVVPSDDQWKSLWSFDTHNDAVQTSTKAILDDGRSVIDTSKRPESSVVATLEIPMPYSGSEPCDSSINMIATSTDVESKAAAFITPVSLQPSQATQTSTSSKNDSETTEVSTTSRKRSRRSIIGDGWISKTSFYDSTSPVVPSEAYPGGQGSRERLNASLQDHESTTVDRSCNSLTHTPKNTQTIETIVQAQRRSTGGNKENEATHVESEILSQCEETEDTHWEEPKRTALFRSTSKRANKRFKQASLRGLFGRR